MEFYGGQNGTVAELSLEYFGFPLTILIALTAVHPLIARYIIYSILTQMLREPSKKNKEIILKS